MTRAPDADRPRRPRVFLVGYYGVGNVGDEAIRTAIERAATLLGVDVAAWASRGPSDDPRAVRTGLRGLPGQFRAILACDRVVLGGGGILKDEGLRLPAELLVTAIVARLARRPVSLLGVGAGPFYRRTGRWLIAAVARLSQVRTVRDADSVTALRALGVRDVTLAADPIFSIDSGPDGRTPDPDRQDHTPGDTADRTAGPDPTARRRAVVSIRPWFHKVGDPGQAAALRTALRTGLAAGLAPLVGAGWRVDLVAMYWPRDAEVSRDLAAALPPTSGGALALPEGPITWDGLVATVGDADLVVAMRYHAVAAAAMAGRPTVAIAYEPKVAGLAADLGIPVIAVDAADLGERLAGYCAAASGGSLPGGPDPAAVDRLRQRAWSGLRAALLG